MKNGLLLLTLACGLLGVTGCAGPGSLRWERETLAALGSETAIVRRRALEEVEGPLTGRVREAIVTILLSAPQPVERSLAAGALGRVGETVCAEDLARAALQDPHWVVRRRAIAALGAVSPEFTAGVAPVALARDPEPAVRVAAVDAAAQALPAGQAAAMILPALDDRSEAVVIAAHAQLVRLTGKDIPPTEPDAWRSAITAPPDAGKP